MFMLLRNACPIYQIIISSSVKIPRYYFSHNTRPTNIQLHCFSDAASQGYAAVVYLRSEYPNGSVDVKLVASKTRVAPVKQQSVPHLEPLGAVILTRLAHTILSSFPMQIQCFNWVESMAVLYWIKNNKPWKQLC